MPGELLIAAGPGEWRAAWVEAGIALELHVERGDVAPYGSIHLGRVVRLAPGLDSAFVEIGEERPGLLPAREAAALGLRLDEGAPILVQVRREAQQQKGARLSARLVPRDPDSAPAQLAARAAALDPPARLDPPPGFAAALALRLPAAPLRVRADDAAAIAPLRAAFPAAEIAHEAADFWPVDLDAVFDGALAPTLALAGGGSIHIAETHAAVMIDVDSGTPLADSAERAALAVNLAAARVIAREVRLRQLGGGIVVDFVGLDGRPARERVRRQLAAALAGDPAQPQIEGWTRLGHLELVRRRRSRPLSNAFFEPGGDPPKKHAVALAHEALRACYRAARARPEGKWRLVVSAPVGAALRGAAAAGLSVLKARLGRPIAISVEPGVGDARGFDIAPQ